ncbi:hypothetical protein AAFC00_006673 [Neodothiora populina]|uniref:C-CAP/cofactor C-like domain-containing protein n=1 Tax=Neodothiora populina TaxID=2781224 RepID=A0ABR3PB60_9PEZI
MTATMQSQQHAQISDQDRFFRFFQGEVNALQERMQQLDNYSAAGGERNDAVDYCLSGIAKLTSEVKDASSYLPAYDQRTYTNTIKTLSDKLQKARASFAPRQKFSFKSGFQRKNASAISMADAEKLASKQHLSAPGNSSTESSVNPTPLDSPVPEPADGQISSSDGTSNDAAKSSEDPGARSTLRLPSFSSSNTITISNHTDQHLILPTTASHATASGTISHLRNCVVDMTLAASEAPTTAAAAPAAPAAPSQTTPRPLAALYLRDIHSSLIVCGQVDGAAHITNVHNSVIVLSTRQFRMHESSNCVVYLHCASHPIIEDCRGLAFTTLPEVHISKAQTSTENQYDQVDDFKWLRADKSPNWSVLDVEKRVSEHVWRDIVPGKPGLGAADVLAAIGVKRRT